MRLRQRLVGMFGQDGRSKIESPPRRDDLAMVLDGGGARAAYQVGLLRSLARRHPDLRLPMLTGVSAGALNAAFLAAHPGPFVQAVDELASAWISLTVDQVFRSDSKSLVGNLWHWGGAGDLLLDAALEAGVISRAEVEQVLRADRVRDEVIQVDAFPAKSPR